MAGHTKGPWTVDRFEIYADEDCETHPIADCTPNGSCRLEGEELANARLIAAAPDLLEALQLAERLERGPHIESDREWIRLFEEVETKRRAAIAKATQP